MSEKTGKKAYKKSMFFEARPAARGMLSIAIGIICVVIIIIGISFSYYKGGNAGEIVGSLAFTALILSGFGIYFALAGFKEEEKNYLPCKIGVIWCGCVAVFIVFLFFTGL